jgi:biotin carboxyl carrier protein
MKKYIVGENEIEFNLLNRTNESLTINLNEKDFHFELINRDDNFIYLKVNGVSQKVRVSALSSAQSSGIKHVFAGGQTAFVESLDGRRSRKKEEVEGNLISPMPGKIFKIFLSEGQEVKKGEVVLILEAMKMEHSIKANQDGIIKKIFFKEGEQVTDSVLLVEIE